MPALRPRIECFALETEISQLQARLPTLDGGERVEALVAMAWHLRQRDDQQALKLADYATQLNHESGDPEPVTRARSARLALVRAEVATLACECDAADAHLSLARPIFDELGDDEGAGDAWAIAAMNAWTRADFASEVDCWNAALARYSLGDDVIRRDVAAERVALWLAQRSRNRSIDNAPGLTSPMVGVLRGLANEGSIELGAETKRSDHPAVAALQLGVQGFRFEGSSDHARKVVAFARASRLAAEAGMIRLAIIGATRAAQGFLDLGDTEAAAVWSDQAYALAKPTKWPGVLAKCHVIFGTLLHRIGSLERSREVFTEAMPLAGRSIGLCKWGLARTMLDLGSIAEAQQLLADAADEAEKIDDAVAFCGIELERARALTLLDRLAEASEQIARARARAAEEQITTYDVAFLEAQADVYFKSAQIEGSPTDRARTNGLRSGADSAVHLLRQSIEIGLTQPGWEPPPTLLVKLARAQAATGDLAAAVENYERSIDAADLHLARRVRDRIAAAQAQDEIERARRDAEAQQRLARAESSRANDLQAMLDSMRVTQEALARRTEELERLSMLDALTGVPNRRHMDERAIAEMALMRRKSTLLALVLFDLDHFKMINDTYGHAAGDIVLKKVAETARALLRPSDFIARVGGEEFTLLLPRTNAQGAATIADRIRQALMGLNIIYAEFRIPVTASFGVTLLTESDNDIADAMSRADVALYRAKRDGRNMVRIEAV